MEKSPSDRSLSPFLFFLLFVTFVALVQTKTSICTEDDYGHVVGTIGGVIDQRCRVGKEQTIGIQMAVIDFNQCSNSSKMASHVRDSHGKSARAASTAIDLVKHKKVQVIIGALTLQEATLVSEFEEVTNTPIITISTAAIFPSPLFPQTPSIFQMSNDITIQMQCAAAIIGHFGWQKVTVVYENSNNLYSDSRLTTQLSESLKPFSSVVERSLSFPSISTLLEPEAYIQDELSKLRSKSSGIFVLVKSSLEFAIVLFEKAKEMGLMEKDYAWILYDDIVSLLDSVDPSILENMQGIIGFKTKYADKGKSFQDFKLRFRRKFRSAYPEEEEHPNPSIYAFRAYDATLVAAKAMQNLNGKMNSCELINYISSSDFEGLSGKIRFKNGRIWQNTTFQIINVIGKSYRKIAIWSPERGFSMDFEDQEGKEIMENTGIPKELDSIYWPGGEQTVPKEFKLKIGVPAKAAVHQFVDVKYDKENRISISGFSIEVFEAAVKLLPYYLSYVLIPFNGTYDEMVIAVYNKSLDATVADMGIMDDRYDYVEFSQPYMDCQIVMVVTAKEDLKQQRFIVVKAFEWKLWMVIAVLSLSTGAIIYFSEHVNDNPEFAGSFPQIIGSMLWFSVTLLSFAQRESIKNRYSRLVLAVWLFVILVITASYTAVLSSMMTVPRLQPSIVDIDYLQKTNAAVGCYGKGYMQRYLMHTLKFKKESIKIIDSISDYPEAFEKGHIAAAFLISPHAKVFLANNSKRYIMAKPRVEVGGLAYAFPKGSPLTADISKAVLNLKQNGEINQMEERLLSLSNRPSAAEQVDDLSLDLAHFSGPIIVSSVITAVVFLITFVRVIDERWSIHETIQSWLMHRRIPRWASFLLVYSHAKLCSRFLGTTHIQRPNNQTNTA